MFGTGLSTGIMLLTTTVSGGIVTNNGGIAGWSGYFGSSLLNSYDRWRPVFKWPSHLTILKYCDQVTGFAVNGTTNSG
jgi:hypothetical protein